MANAQFVTESTHVYGVRDNERVLIATTESESWAQTIADALNSDPDVYIV